MGGNAKEALHSRVPQQKGTNPKHTKAKKTKEHVSFEGPTHIWSLHVITTGNGTHNLLAAEALVYPLGYRPSLTNVCTRMVLILDQFHFSIELS